MKIFIILLATPFLLLPTSTFAEQTCNPVAIKVDANPIFYATKNSTEAEALYNAALKEMNPEDRVVKLKEAYLKYKEAYKIIYDDRATLSSEVMKKQCADSPMIYGAPNSNAK